MGESLSLKQSFCVHKLVLLAKNICGYERLCLNSCSLWTNFLSGFSVGLDLCCKSFRKCV